jgi:hypothetical protein
MDCRASSMTLLFLFNNNNASNSLTVLGLLLFFISNRDNSTRPTVLGLGQLNVMIMMLWEEFRTVLSCEASRC